MNADQLGVSFAKLRLDQLALSWRGCTDCPQLALGRSRVVFYRGNPDAKLAIVGAAPSRDDDARGLPFVGAAGKVVDELLSAAKVSFGDVCMLHMLGCRTPQDRAPRTAELRACAPRTLAMLMAIKPRAVLMMGITPAKLAGVIAVGPWRGVPVDVKLNAHTVRGVVTYRPEFLLELEARGDSAHGLRAMMVSDIKVARSLAMAGEPIDDERA